MDKAESWFKLKGMDFYYGNTNPLDPDDAMGILIEGFVDQPAVMSVYNKPYYQKLFEDRGFYAHEDLYGYKLTIEDVPYERYEKIDKLKERFGFEIRSADKKHVDRDARDIIEIINNSITDDWDMRTPEPENVYKFLDTWKNFLDFDYVSSNELIASVDEDGIIQGLTAGECQVEVSLHEYPTIKVVITVEIEEEPEPMFALSLSGPDDLFVLETLTLVAGDLNHPDNIV